MSLTREHNLVRCVTVDACACSQPFIDKFGQPALHVFSTYPTAASYREYLEQDDALHVMLDRESACVHVREIAVRTHKTLCGNDRHLAIAKRALCFPGIDPELAEAFLANP